MTRYTKFDAANPPPPLSTGEPNSFAHKTITTRKPKIIKQVLADFADTYPAQIVQNLTQLHHEITLNRPLRPLKTVAPDGPAWTKAWQPHQNKGWHNIPWYFAESFLYRRLVEAVNYFGGNGENLSRWQGVDPFLPRKREELQSDIPWQVLAAALTHTTANTNKSLWALLHHCVWGNRIDLSYNQVAQDAGREIAIHHEQENLLVDDAEAVVAHLIPPPNASRRVDFICDNTGTELLMDLALADFLLRSNRATEITLHVKAHPTFVSDAMMADVEIAIAATNARPQVSPLARRLKEFRRRQRLHVQPDFFWNSSRFFWDIPDPLRAQLARAHLVIIKGDANYRRLLGDSDAWPPTVPLADAVPYFPAPFVALRTMKSDPVVGLKPGQAEALNKVDAAWRVNGKRGMIQALL